MQEISKLPDYLYAEIEAFSSITDKSATIKVKIPIELINRINEIITLLNILSKSKIIRSAIALEKENEEKYDSG